MKIPFESGVEVEITKGMMEAVMDEFERENPGKSAFQMEPEEFSRRLMAKIKVTGTS